MQLNLTKPIVFFDLETTGVQVGSDRIVQICLLKVLPDGTDCELTYLVRPTNNQGTTMHIPEESTAVHHITDDMVAHEKSFRELAPAIAEFIGDADLAGYNSNKFDVPLLVEEFMRAGVEFTLEGRHLVDVQNIFHRMEQRTLVAAYKFYCGKTLDGAHSADADTRATYEVLKAQLDRYQQVPYVDHDGTTTYPVVNDVEALSRFTCNAQWADLVGHIGYDKAGREVFNFGKHKGTTLEQVFMKEPAYYDWMMKADFPLSTKQVVMRVQRRMVEERRKRDQEKLQALKLKFEG
ncbi:MAG: 3'-5' exonuclease [Bacteroidales bacterium]|jgi:DNA polymerase-3 subunit epsilon|nr:3'-5' exonuclease [Bacteroidales bacterium]